MSDIIEIESGEDVWKFPREWFTKIEPNRYYGLDLTKKGYGMCEANILWFLGYERKNISDRFLTKDFTGVKLEQFWEMVEYLAEDKNYRITVNYARNFFGRHKDYSPGDREYLLHRRYWEINKPEDKYGDKFVTGNSGPTGYVFPPTTNQESVDTLVSIENTFTIQDIIKADQDNELGREELMAALKDIGVDEELAYESKEVRLGKLKELLDGD